MRKVFAVTLLAVALFSIVVCAHPGGTDSKGGHHNSSTGEYHYHHGYSAHQHTNGKCPYDFKDMTDSSSDSTYSEKHSQSTERASVNSSIGKKLTMTDVAAIIVGLTFCWMTLYPVSLIIADAIRDRFKKK